MLTQHYFEPAVVCHLAFDVRMHSFTPLERVSGSLTSRLIEAAETTNKCVLPTDQGLKLWRLFETRTYRRLRRSQQFMESVAVDLVAQKVAAFQQGNSAGSILEEYLQNPQLNVADVVGMASDVLLAGIDTVSIALFLAIIIIDFEK